MNFKKIQELFDKATNALKQLATDADIATGGITDEVNDLREEVVTRELMACGFTEEQIKAMGEKRDPEDEKPSSPPC